MEHRIVNGTKYKVRFKEFIKSSKRTGRLAWYDLLVQNDAELVDGIPLYPNGKQIGLNSAVDGINMFLDACSILRIEECVKYVYTRINFIH